MRTTYEPVRQSVEVPVNQVDAFNIFTREAESWWPLRSHSIAGQKAIKIFFELRPAGRIYEIDSEGTEHDWGRIIECDPPNRILASWHPGHPEEDATELEIVFHDLGHATRVDLEHRNWDRLGDGASMYRESYDRGWVEVLGLFSQRAKP